MTFATSQGVHSGLSFLDGQLFSVQSMSSP
jgi:hypothetical protein